MYQVGLTLPVKQHNGTSNLDTIQHIKTVIAESFGGFSSSQISGGWIDNGHLYEDESILVWTFVDSQAKVDSLKSQAGLWANALQQIELLVTVSENVAVSFVEGTRAQAVA